MERMNGDEREKEKKGKNGGRADYKACRVAGSLRP